MFDGYVYPKWYIAGIGEGGLSMMHGIHKFENLWAWFIVKDNKIVEQGRSEDEEQAKSDYESALGFWSLHDYERD